MVEAWLSKTNLPSQEAHGVNLLSATHPND